MYLTSSLGFLWLLYSLLSCLIRYFTLECSDTPTVLLIFIIAPVTIVVHSLCCDFIMKHRLSVHVLWRCKWRVSCVHCGSIMHTGTGGQNSFTKSTCRCTKRMERCRQFSTTSHHSGWSRWAQPQDADTHLCKLWHRYILAGADRWFCYFSIDLYHSAEHISSRFFRNNLTFGAHATGTVLILSSDVVKEDTASS